VIPFPPAASRVFVILAGAGSEATRPSVFCCSAGPPNEWGCSYLRRWNRSSVRNGTLGCQGFLFIAAIEA
jgi:hypothetical protein